jgi:hypothetical protein
MYITRKHLSRRTLLKGLGTAVALPFLDSMVPAFAAPGVASTAYPNRLFFTYIPIGAIMDEWIPTGSETDFQFKRILQPLTPYKDDLLILGNLDCHNGYALGDGGGDHARAGAAYLTGVHPKKTSGADIHAGVSVDQIIAMQKGSATKFASLELGCEDSRTVGACDSGYSCAYQNSVSWRTPNSPMPPETNPRVVFERMFGTEDLSVPADVRARRAAARKSILDFVSDDTKRIESDLGPSDRHKIDEYLYAVREIEKRIENAEHENRQFVPSVGKPAGVPVLFADYLKLMFDLQFLAIQADLTRTATFMIGREGSQRTYDEIGIPEPHHPLTHHRGNKESIEKVTQINTFHAQQLAYFLNKMKSTREGDGSLLDHSMMVYGSGIADGSEHSHVNLPILIAGKGNGQLKTGRSLKYAAGTPVTNLWLTLLDRLDVHPESVGDSTGRLEHLTNL